MAQFLRERAGHEGVKFVAGEAEKLLAGQMAVVAGRLRVTQRTALERYLTGDDAVDAAAPIAITLGSAGNVFWGGLRVGWIRASRQNAGLLGRARVALDLGVPVSGQPALARLPGREDILRAQRARLARQRDALTIAPGPAFAVREGLDRFVRVPWTQPEGELAQAVERLAAAWPDARGSAPSHQTASVRVMAA